MTRPSHKWDAQGFGWRPAVGGQLDALLGGGRHFDLFLGLDLGRDDDEGPCRYCPQDLWSLALRFGAGFSIHRGPARFIAGGGLRRDWIHKLYRGSSLSDSGVWNVIGQVTLAGDVSRRVALFGRGELARAFRTGGGGLWSDYGNGTGFDLSAGVIVGF